LCVQRVPYQPNQKRWAPRERALDEEKKPRGDLPPGHNQTIHHTRQKNAKPEKPGGTGCHGEEENYARPRWAQKKKKKNKRSRNVPGKKKRGEEPLGGKGEKVRKVVHTIKKPRQDGRGKPGRKRLKKRNNPGGMAISSHKQGKSRNSK